MLFFLVLIKLLLGDRQKERDNLLAIISQYNAYNDLSNKRTHESHRVAGQTVARLTERKQELSTTLGKAGGGSQGSSGRLYPGKA